MVTVKQVMEMIRLYKAGFSQDWIAERFGISQSTVHYHLHRHGSRIKFRKPGYSSAEINRLSHEELERTVFLYTVNKLTIYEIGRLLNRNPSTIHERLRRAGVEMRSPSEAQKLSWAKRRAA